MEHGNTPWSTWLTQGEDGWVVADTTAVAREAQSIPGLSLPALLRPCWDSRKLFSSTGALELCSGGKSQNPSGFWHLSFSWSESFRPTAFPAHLWACVSPGCHFNTLHGARAMQDERQGFKGWMKGRWPWTMFLLLEHSSMVWRDNSESFKWEFHLYGKAVVAGEEE